MKRKLAGVVVVVCTVALGAFILEAVQFFYVPSGAMAPTLLMGDRLLVSKLAYHIGHVKHGHIVLFRADVSRIPGYAAMRVTALPGDEIEIREKRGLFLNGKLLKESYVEEPPSYNWGPHRVPPGNCVVLGDNRNNSNDSHIWGFLPLDDIRGKVSLRLWPSDRIGGIR